tara:strand:- start:239 stop:757 length:519 start_codon:yes stop_codon:yes gene_type:complete
MEEIILSKSCIHWGTLPKSSRVNNKVILESMLDDNKYWEENSPDIKLTHSKHHTWLISYIVEKLRAEDQNHFGKLAGHTFFGNVDMPGYASLRRNHYNRSDLKNSPGAVIMYFLNGSGEVHIENDDPPDLDRVFRFTIKPGRFLCFNSNLTYMRTKNEEKEPRGVAVFTVYR